MSAPDAPVLDATHDPARRSWVASANEPGCDFPIQNLPYCVFRPSAGEGARIGVGIGDRVLDLAAAAERGLLDGLAPDTRCALAASTLNDVMALGRAEWRAARAALADLLDAGATPHEDLLHAMDAVTYDVPARIGDYTDFYCSIHHATNVGSMFRPDNPLLPNYRHLPIGYHGRASSIVISGTEVRRPRGQRLPADGEPPVDEAIKLFDYELEMGFYVGPGNALGDRIPIAEAGEHLFGMSIVNDWSARDVQKWEYQPLGPFNAKNFCTTVGAWVVTMDALAPYREDGPTSRPADDPPLLEYLRPAGPWQLDVTCEVLIASRAMRDAGTPAHRVSTGSFRDMYWTVAQMLVHHASTGCNMSTGDLIASGTLSGPEKENRGCLLERTWRGTEPIELPDGTERKFLQDGDEVIIRAFAEKDGAARVGFGECRGIVAPAVG
jgi:fumarylacetoacetase